MSKVTIKTNLCLTQNGEDLEVRIVGTAYWNKTGDPTWSNDEFTVVKVTKLEDGRDITHELTPEQEMECLTAVKEAAELLEATI